MKHTTRDGKDMRIRDMTDLHLANTIALHERRAEEGVTVCRGGGGPDPSDMWFDVYEIYGKEALEHLGHHHYVREQRRRAKLKEREKK